MNGTETKTATTKAITPETSEAITNTASTDEITDTTPDSKTTETSEASSSPLTDYLAEGYYKGESSGRYINPDLVGVMAQTIAKALADGGLKSSGINPILRELKKSNKKMLPLEAKRGALAGAIVTAKQLQQRHRAPGLLVDILERNRGAVQTDADYKAAVKHLTAVGVFLGDYQH